MAHNPALSLIVPTRQRTGPLRRLLDSIVTTAADPGGLEVVLVVDADDLESNRFRFDGVPLKRVVVQPGLPMGALNGAGHDASSGDYLMLLNDDVVARTGGWDAVIRNCFKRFPDGILLVHVNDTLFQKALCTFPVVSRTFCRLAGGICPPDYVRYRIDDHIEDVFNLLGVLGERRTVYLPDVVFQHCKCVEDGPGQKKYFLDEKILALDAPRFEALFSERKELALRLKDHIVSRAPKTYQRIGRSRLEAIPDSFSLRREPHRQRVWSRAGAHYAGDARVTIGLITPDSQGQLFRSCLRAIRANTSNYELIVLDDQTGPDVNRARTRNRLLEAARPNYLVLMEDNSRVGPYWLWDLFRGLGPDVGLVTAFPPVPSGRVMRPDCVVGPPGDVITPARQIHTSPQRQRGISLAGAAGWCADPPCRGNNAPPRVLTVCSPLVLIDTAKCHHLFFDEAYRSNLAYTDFGLQAWEAGLAVVGAPLPTVVHRAPGPRPLGDPGPGVAERERRLFFDRWIESGRLRELEAGAWLNVPELRPLAGLSSEVKKHLLGEYLDLLIDLDRTRPAWRQTWMGRLGSRAVQGLWRLRGCWQRQGWRGLVQVASKRLGWPSPGAAHEPAAPDDRSPNSSTSASPHVLAKM
jgi:hypothetical protein